MTSQRYSKSWIVYHGTKGNFSAFSPTVIKILATFFTSSKQVADAYGDRIIAAHVILEKPLILSAEGNSWENIPYTNDLRCIARINGFRFDGYEDGTIDTDTLVKLARSAGYDGLVVEEIEDAPGFGNAAALSSIVAAFSVEQIQVLPELCYRANDLANRIDSSVESKSPSFGM